MINISYFCNLLGLWEIVAVDHLRIDISCISGRAPLYHPMLILACLTGVSGLVFHLCQWSQCELE